MSIMGRIHNGLPVLHLKIAECIVTRKNAVISTVLGSCVACSFYHRATKTAGMFHAILPSSSMVMNNAPYEPCRFADTAIEQILKRFTEMSIPLRDVEIKMFGGAFCTTHIRKNTCRPDLASVVDVGAKNVDVAQKTLAARNLTVLKEDVRGNRSRKLIFEVETGDVWMKYLTADQDSNSELKAEARILQDVMGRR